jgi:non-canonical purine NTP pyrophosphatase (RdgB/HAM1 family)
MPDKKLYFVSSNEEKYREIRGALAGDGFAVERVALDLPEIQAIDPAAVATYKARKAYKALGTGPVLVEDTGLGVAAWNGYPGALIKWVLGAVGEAGLCRQLDAWNDRKAVATVILCLFDGEQAHTFAGHATGLITSSPHGEHGFGWDSIFQPDGYAITYGEMQREDKMQISMRTRALDALRGYLAETS